MAELGLTSEDVFGAVGLVNFRSLEVRLGVTDNFEEIEPISSTASIATWLSAQD